MIDSVKFDGFYSDMFKGVYAKGIASAMNNLCEWGKLALFSSEGEMLAYYKLKGTEFNAKEFDGNWIIHGVPLDYCHFIKSGFPATVKIMAWGGETICEFPTNRDYFSEGMDFDSYITLSF